MKFIFLLFSIIFSSTFCFSQFNFKVGYQYSYATPTTHNLIIDQLNANNSSLGNYRKMSALHPMNGVVLGARYRFEPVGLFFEWGAGFQVNEFSGEDATTGSTIFRNHFYRFDSYSLGLEFFIANFSFGGSFDNNSFRVRAENSERNDRYIMYKDQAWGSHFFVAIHLLGNENLSIGLQPYIRIPWTNFDLTDFENELGTDSNLGSYEEEFMVYGFRIIFQNGRFKK